MEKILKKSSAQSNQGQSSTLHTKRKKPQEMDPFIEMAVHGHWPLLDSQWTQFPCFEIWYPGQSYIPRQDRFISIIDQLSKHQNIERKRTVVMSLSWEDRQLFVLALMKLVEDRILDNGPELQ